MVHNRPVFDLDYIRTFRILHNFKQMLQSSMVSFFMTSAQSSLDFKSAPSTCPGKCVPSVAFIFNALHYGKKVEILGIHSI